jgi:hypothetical protein
VYAVHARRTCRLWPLDATHPRGPSPPEEFDTILEFCSTDRGTPRYAQGTEHRCAADDKAIREITARSLALGESAHREPFEVTVDMMADAIRGGADQMGSLYEMGLKC